MATKRATIGIGPIAVILVGLVFVSSDSLLLGATGVVLIFGGGVLIIVRAFPLAEPDDRDTG